jgi:hypothetical protein
VTSLRQLSGEDEEDCKHEAAFTFISHEIYIAKFLKKFEKF